MHKGFYVVRMPFNGAGSRLIVESKCFQKADAINKPDIDDEWIRLQVDNWCDFVQSQHPKDDVFVIER